MKTWGPLRRLKVVNKGLIQGDIKTLGDFLDLGEFDCLSGRTEFKYQDLCKIGILLKSQGVELEETIYGTMSPSYFLKDWLPKFDKLFKSKGIFYNSVHCDMGVNLGLERNVSYHSLMGNEIVFLNNLRFSLRDDYGNEVTKLYPLNFVTSGDGDLQKLVVDFIKSPHWYKDYIESLYEEVLVYLLDWFVVLLNSGEPVSRIVRVLSNELVRLDAKRGA